ncbi:MAG: cytochrome c-type biogenesis protein CcmH [Gemmatimonadetes bacterium]|nr:cytochrome c-type biogenesis protein CcmH [Gemmatimonadota bacterium]
MSFATSRPALGIGALRALFTGLALACVLAPDAAAQSAGPTGPASGHFHEGLTGDQWLVIERNIKCQCGCGLDVHSCQFQMQCDTSPGWSQRIRRDLEAGITQETIQASFVADFGSQVLMAPPPEGFNLLGYLLPGATMLVAAGLIGAVARGRMRGREPAPITEVSDEDAERLRAEWQKLDEAESPDW